MPSHAHPLDQMSAPSSGRARLRIAALLALVALWVLPSWATAQVGDQTQEQSGAIRSGAPAAFALVALWGLGGAALVTRTARQMRAGAAVTDALLALVLTILLATEHPWMPGGDARAAWVPAFAPLVLLAALEAVALYVRRHDGHEIAVIRGVAALFAATALYLDRAFIPAGAALWLGLAPLVFLRADTARRARLALEGWTLMAGVLAGLAPWIQKAVVGVAPAVKTDLSVWVYLWCVTAALVVTSALDGVLRSAEDAAPPRSS